MVHPPHTKNKKISFDTNHQKRRDAIDRVSSFLMRKSYIRERLMKNKPIPTLFLILLLLVVYADALHSQDTIPLKNPSFEGVPQRGMHGKPFIKMWNDCGLSQFPSDSPPDIHPVIDNAWGVSMLAQDGETYLGLVVRANASWESVSQRLFIPLRAGVCYSLTAMLALSDIYESATAISLKLGTFELENFANPVMLVI